MKKKVGSKNRNKNRKIPTDNLQKETFLNSSYLSAESNRNLINSLNNRYKNYVSYSIFEEPLEFNNLRITCHRKLLKLKNRLKHSFQLLQDFNDKFIFNRIPKKVKKNKSEILIDDLYKDEETNNLLNISVISNKNRKSLINEFEKDNNQININNNYKTKRVIFSPQHRNLINNKKIKNASIYKESRNNSAMNNRRNISQDDSFLGKVSKKLNKKIDSTNLFKKTFNINKIENNTTYRNNKNHSNYNSYKNHLIRPKSCNERHNNLLSSKNPYISYKSIGRVSSAYNKTNETTIINKNNNNNNKLCYFSPKSNKSMIYNNTILKQNLTNLTNIKNRRKKFSAIYSNTSSQNTNHTPFLFSPRNHSRYFLSKKATETKNQIGEMASSTINKSKIINSILTKNYSEKEKPRLKIKKREPLEEKKFDWKKVRNELKLKKSNGLLANIDEIELLENDLKKMEKKLSEKRFNILLSAAKRILRHDLLVNKQLIYNVGIDNRLYRIKYFKLYDRLNNKSESKNKNKKKKKLVEKYIIN